MAERTRSRRTTPQPVADTTSNAELSNLPRRSTRAMRSQSRELSDDEGLGAWKVKKESRKHGLGEERANARKGRGPKSSSEQQEELSVVVEDPSITYPELRDGRDRGAEEVSEIGQQAQAEGAPDSTSPGGASAFSGTTVRASRNAQELEDLVSDGLLDALPDLTSAADKLLDFLVPTNLSEITLNDIRQQLASRKSRSYKNFQRLSNAFNVQREAFGNGLLIDLRGTLKVLVDSQDLVEFSTDSWRPDPLLQKANLAALTAKILSSSSALDLDSLWEELDQNLPNYFATNRHDVASPQLFQVALEVRTQHAVTQLMHCVNRPNFDSDEVLAQIFNERGGSFRYWDCDGMRVDDLPNNLKKILLLRFSGIRDMCQQTLQSSEGASELGIQLVSSFPWATFSYIIVAWVRDHLEELKAIVDQNGGIESIVQSLSNEIQKKKGVQPLSRENHNLRDESPQVVLNFEPPSGFSNIMPGQAGNSNLRRAREEGLKTTAFSSASPKLRFAAAHLNNRRKITADKTRLQGKLQQPQQNPSEIQVASTAGPSVRVSTPQRQAQGPQQPSSTSLDGLDQPQPDHDEDTWQRHEVEDDEQDDDDDAFQTGPDVVKNVVTISSQQQAESNKENEVQPTLSRVDGGKRKRLIDAQPNARRVPSISQDSSLEDQDNQSSDLSEDEGIQQSRLPPTTTSSLTRRNTAKRRATAARMTQQSPPKRDRAQADPRSSHTRDSQPRVLQEQQIPQSQAQNYYVVSAAAKMRRPPGRSKATQSRTPWSEEEIEQLISLIGLYGASYAQIKKRDDEQGGLLENRDQVALKDKARNMKLDYLKGGLYLPANFEKIPLSVNLVGRLEALGIDYDRDTGHRRDGLWGPGQVGDDEE